jgi:clan AA aspartic protease
VITGQVNYSNEAVIAVHLLDGDDKAHSVDAVIDTGFSGFLTLPLALINTLKWPFIESQVFSLGNNSRATIDVYAGTINWAGKENLILVLASDAHPLVGMSQLKGQRITIDAVDGGPVRIEALTGAQPNSEPLGESP